MMKLCRVMLPVLLLPLTGAAPSAGAIELQLEGVRSASGRIRIDVYAPPRRHVLKRIVPASAPGLSLTMPVERGAYAVMIYHDENGNGKLDKGLLGMPVEGYAFSNNAKPRLGPPSFEKMRIDVAAGGRTRAAVRMRYP